MVGTGNDLSSFGTLLKDFRKRRRLTQQQFAKAIGVHRSAISRWEQGDFLPASKAMVLELARHLHLDDQETRWLLEASLIALSPYWHVPFPRNLFFTGREEVLNALHTHLCADQIVALTQSYALHGLGGVGKTQIALEYAYRHALEYSAVFWIGAETSENIVSGLLRIAEILQLPGRDDKDQQRVIEAVRQWLATHRQWLLIWDNVEDLAVLDRFLPSARQGAILLTTRCQVLGTLTRGMDLLPMKQEEGMLFLLRRAKVVEAEATREHLRQFAVNRPAEYATTEQLMTVMGGLPPALDQAGAYIEETQCGLPAYLELFHARRAALLQQRGDGSRAHPESVSTTFTLTITTTAQRHPAVWDLLRVCALFQPDTIPEELFRQGAEHLGTTLEVVCRDEMEWNTVVSSACSYSLLHRQPEEQTLSMHRVVQAVLLDTMTEGEREMWSRRAIKALAVAFPKVTHDTWKQCERLLPHALACTTGLPDQVEEWSLAEVLQKAADYLTQRAQYKQAELLYERALRIREQALGPEDPEVASTLNNLAILYYEQGKYEQAEPLYRRALRIWEQALGPEHPNVAYSLNNLALLYWEQGKYEQGKPLCQRALDIWEQALGPEHSNVASPLSTLATLHREQGKYAEAGALYQRALSIREQRLGQHHPETAQTLHDLALLRQQQGALGEALSLAQRALQIRSQSLGKAHSKTVATQTLYTQLVQAHVRADEERAASRQGTEQATIHARSVAVRGATEQVSYTRTIRMREVTFTCTICGQTVTQLHYPSGQIKYCSEACRAVRAVEIQEERVARQREKRRSEREAHLRAQQQGRL